MMMERRDLSTGIKPVSRPGLGSECCEADCAVSVTLIRGVGLPIASRSRHLGDLACEAHARVSSLQGLLEPQGKSCGKPLRHKKKLAGPTGRPGKTTVIN